MPLVVNATLEGVAHDPQDTVAKLIARMKWAHRSIGDRYRG